MKIIAFGHRKFVGKDTAANFLCSHLRLHTKGKHIVKKGFASKLKQQVYELYAWAGLKDEEYYEQNQHEKSIILPLLGKSPRQIWIDFGTLVGRAVYHDTWLDYLFKGTKCDYLIIKDLRFENEFNGVQNHGGYCVKVNADWVIPTLDVADEPLESMPDDEWDSIMHQKKEDRNFLNNQVIAFSQVFLGI